MIFKKLKSVLIFLKICTNLLTHRPFGSIIFDIGERYEDITVQELRKYEKLKLQNSKATLDITFLNNCETFNVYPNFLKFRCFAARC